MKLLLAKRKQQDMLKALFTPTSDEEVAAMWRAASAACGSSSLVKSGKKPLILRKRQPSHLVGGTGSSHKGAKRAPGKRFDVDDKVSVPSGKGKARYHGIVVAAPGDRLAWLHVPGHGTLPILQDSTVAQHTTKNVFLDSVRAKELIPQPGTWVNVKQPGDKQAWKAELQDKLKGKRSNATVTVLSYTVGNRHKPVVKKVKVSEIQGPYLPEIVTREDERTKTGRSRVRDMSTMTPKIIAKNRRIVERILGQTAAMQAQMQEDEADWFDKNGRAVQTIAFKAARSQYLTGDNLEDVVSAANLGALEGLRKFETEPDVVMDSINRTLHKRGQSLVTEPEQARDLQAYQSARREARRQATYLSNELGLTGINRQDLDTVKFAEYVLEMQLGRKPSDQEIANHTGYMLNRVMEYRNRRAALQSTFDMLLGRNEDDYESPIESIVSEDLTPEEELERASDEKALTYHVQEAVESEEAHLTPEEKMVVSEVIQQGNYLDPMGNLRREAMLELSRKLGNVGENSVKAIWIMALAKLQGTRQISQARNIAGQMHKSFGLAAALTRRPLLILRKSTLKSCDCGSQPQLYDAAFAGKTVPVSVCGQCGSMKRLVKPVCECGRLYYLTGQIHGMDGEHSFRLCADCGKVHLGSMVKAVIRTPMKEGGGVDYESVPVGGEIWITITKEGPLQGRHIRISKRPDGLFAITGGAKHARLKGYFHAALEFANKRPLTEKQKKRREEYTQKQQEYKAWKKEHKGALSEIKERKKAARGAVNRSLGLEADEDIARRLTKGKNSFYAKTNQILAEQGASPEDAHYLASQLTRAEAARTRLAARQLQKKARIVSYLANRIKEQASPDAEKVTWKEVNASLESAGFETESLDALKKNMRPALRRSGSMGRIVMPEDAPITQPDAAVDALQQAMGEEIAQAQAEAAMTPDTSGLRKHLQKPGNDKVLGRSRESAMDVLTNWHKGAMSVKPTLDTKERKTAKFEAGEHLKRLSELVQVEREARAMKPSKPREPKLHGAMATTNFRMTGEPLSEEDARKAVMKQIGNAIAEDTRGAFYDKVKQLSETPEGEIDADNPFGSLRHYIDNGSIEAINRVSSKWLGKDILGEDIVHALGVQGAVEVLVNRLHEEGRPMEQVQKWVDKEFSKRELATVDTALSRQKQLEDEHGMIDKKAKEDYGEGTALGDSHATELRLENKARQLENMGKALGSLEAIGSLTYALDKGISRSVELSVGEDMEGARQRIGSNLGQVALKRTKFKRKGDNIVAEVPVSALKNKVDRAREVSDNEAELLSIGAGKTNTGKLQVKGVNAGWEAERNFRPGQEADIRHVLRQLDILDKEKSLPPSERTLKGVGLMINREVGGGKSATTLAIAQHLLNQQKSTLGDHGNRPVVITVPDAILGNWSEQVKTWLPGTNALIVGQATGGKKSEDKASSEQYLMTAEQRKKLYDKAAMGQGPRLIIVGHGALNAKHKVGNQEMREYQIINDMQPLMVAHDEPQNLTTAGKAVLGEAGKAATKMGVARKGEDWNSVHVALTATPARKQAVELYDIGNWVTHRGLGPRNRWEKKNGSLGKGTNIFEGELGDGILKEFGKQMNSEAGIKAHTPHETSRKMRMSQPQKQRQSAIEKEYDQHIGALKKAIDGKKRSGTFQVKTAKGWSEKTFSRPSDMRMALDRLKQKRDEEHFNNLYGSGKQSDWHEVPAVQEAHKTIDERLKVNPREKIILFAPHAHTVQALKGMIAEKYGREAVTTMVRNSEMADNMKAFQSPEGPQFVIAGSRAYAGFNLQNADGSIFVGLPPEAMQHIQAQGRHERDPRKGDPWTVSIGYEDSPIEHQYNHWRANQHRLIAATNRAVRGRKPLPLPDDMTHFNAQADAYQGEYSAKAA